MNNNIIVYYIAILILFVLILFYLLLFTLDFDHIDPIIFEHPKISKIDKLKLKMHGAHFSGKSIKKLVDRIVNQGMTFEEAHHGIPMAANTYGHLRHITIEINKIMLRSFYIVVGTLGGYLIVDIVKEFANRKWVWEKLLWKIIISLIFFLLVLLLFSVGAMNMKHRLSMIQLDTSMWS